MDEYEFDKVLEMQYSVIARNKFHDLNIDQIKEIRSFLYFELRDHVSSEDAIYYEEPNFIIYNILPQVQRTILSTPILQNKKYALTLVPWTRENELCLIPWMTGIPVKDYDIEINPVAMLPPPPLKPLYRGNPKLGDDIVRSLKLKPDWKAPDLSYIMAAELKMFYLLKRTYFFCNHFLIKHIQNLMESFCTELNSCADGITYTIQELADKHGTYTELNAHLHRLLFRTIKDINKNCDIITESRLLTETEVDLLNFHSRRDIVEKGAPLPYISRLKKIHSLASEKIAATRTTITSEEVAPQEYQASIFLNKHHRRGIYHTIPHHDKAVVEFFALRHSFRYMLNYQSRKIIDVNFPTLEKLISAISGQNSDLVHLELCATSILTDTQNMHDDFLGLIDDLKKTETPELLQPILNIETSVTNHFNTIQSLYTEFIENKMQYLLIVFDEETPDTNGSRWTWVTAPPPFHNA